MNQYAIPSILLATLLLGCNENGSKSEPAGIETATPNVNVATSEKTLSFNTWVSDDKRHWLQTELFERLSFAAIVFAKRHQAGVCRCVYALPEDDFQMQGTLKGIMIYSEDVMMDDVPELAHDGEGLSCEFIPTDPKPHEELCLRKHNTLTYELSGGSLFVWYADESVIILE